MKTMTSTESVAHPATAAIRVLRSRPSSSFSHANIDHPLFYCPAADDTAREELGKEKKRVRPGLAAIFLAASRAGNPLERDHCRNFVRICPGPDARGR